MKPDPAPRRRPPDRLRHAAGLLGQLVLGAILLMTALVLWHLRRRGRLLRERGARARSPGRPFELETLDGTAPRANADPGDRTAGGDPPGPAVPPA